MTLIFEKGITNITNFILKWYIIAPVSEVTLVSLQKENSLRGALRSHEYFLALGNPQLSLCIVSLSHKLCVQQMPLKKATIP